MTNTQDKDARSEPLESELVECENCGEDRFTWEACQHCGNRHWRDD